MGQLILFNMMTLDGYFEGINKELDWHNVDAEFNEFATEQLSSAGNVIFGRKTYELMAEYWPNKQASENHPIIAEKMNNIKKNVFSKTMNSTTWANTNLFSNNLTNVVSEIKNGSEKNALILGSSNLGETLIKNGLVDLIRIMINPIILGNGNPLFTNIKHPIRLELNSVRSFQSGNVLLEYHPK